MEITADFTSHSGKEKQNLVPVETKGCEDPTLDVELSNRRKGELTDIDLSLGSPGTAIKSVEYRMPRQLHWGYRKRLSSRVAGGGRSASGSRAAQRGAAKRTKKIKRLTSAGTATFLTSSGERKVRFKAKRTKRGNLGFTPLVRKTREGQVVAAQVPGFAASLFRTTRRRAATGAESAQEARKQRSKRKRTRRKRKRRKTDLTLTGLPGEDLTAVELSLRGRDRRRKFYLKNPTGCKKPLNFVALVTTTDGRKLAVKDQVRLRGKGCKKKRRKKNS